MLYNLLSLKNIPEPVFAHVYSCPDYGVRFKEMVPNIEIAYIQIGEVQLQILDESITVQERSFLVLPHKYRSIVTASPNKPHLHYAISAMVDAESELVHSMPERLQEGTLCVPLYLDNCSETKKLVELHTEAIREHQKADAISRYKAGLLFAELLCEIAREAQNAVPERKSAAADVLDSRIKKYIVKNLHQKIRVSDIAESIGKNPNYLNQVFKQKNHMSIVSYINQLKMSRVAQLVTDEKMTIRQAAEKVGITDMSYVSRLFHKTMGMTVSELKNNSVDFTFSLNDFEKIY